MEETKAIVELLLVCSQDELPKAAKHLYTRQKEAEKMITTAINSIKDYLSQYLSQFDWNEDFYA